MTHVLIVDDEPELRTSVRKILSRRGFKISEASSAEEALTQVSGTQSFDLILTDQMMPGIGGLELIRALTQKELHIPVVMMTAFASIENAVQTIQHGAADYLCKPFSPEQLMMSVHRALGITALVKENQLLKRQLRTPKRESQTFFIGQSDAIRRIQGLIRRVGPTPLGVLITGESGTGKEVVARSIHASSNRTGMPFVPVDCAAIPANLMESELFGHEKGAFTGAQSNKKGLVDIAEGGTFFLDEIGDLPLAVQVKLLRLLQEGEFRRLGSAQLHKADIRIVAATNRNLEEAVREGSFREDLFHRLNIIRIRLPPLRDRREDIPLLLQHFLPRCASECGRPELSLSQELLDVLQHQYDWPGNVRELVNVIRFLAGLGQGPKLYERDLPPRLQSQLHQTSSKPEASPAEPADAPSAKLHVRYDLPYKSARRAWLEIFEYAYISSLLREHGGNISQAARSAGIDRKSIQRLMKRNGLLAELREDGSTEDQK